VCIEPAKNLKLSTLAPIAPPPKKQKTILTFFDPHLSAIPYVEQSDDLKQSSLAMPYPVTPTCSVKPLVYLWDTTKPTSCNAVLVAYPTPPRPVRSTQVAHPHSDSLIVESIEDEDDDVELLMEATKLKGIIWPGMDIFDAATIAMRKKRNQKKHTSVLERLEQNSLVVEAMERIYSPAGTLKKERKITGQVNFEDSPVMMYEEALPVSTKRRTHVKGPLAEKDPNAPKVKRQPRTSENVDKPRLGKKQSTATAVTKKRTIPVFHDDDSAVFRNPNGMNLLTAEYQPAPAFSNTTPRDSPVKTTDRNNYLAPSYFAEAYDGYQAVNTVQHYITYGYGYDIPGFFSYPPQQRQQIGAGLLALQDADIPKSDV